MESSGDVSPVQYSRGSRDRLQQRARDLKADGNPAWRLYSKEATLCTLTVIGLLALAAQ